MADSMPGTRSGATEAISALRSHTEEYVDLIRTHIDKEDHVLFVMADDMVVGDSCRALCDHYYTVCSRRFGGKIQENLETIAKTLKAR